MASKTEFLQELRSHVTTLKSFSDEITTVISSKRQEIQNLEVSRRTELEDLSLGLLPNLESVNNLPSSLSSSLSTAHLEKMRLDEERPIEARLMEFGRVFNPESYEADKAKLQAEIVLLEGKIIEAKQILDATPGLSLLLRSGYNTPSYPYWIFNLQYYCDWKRADEIVEELNLSDWKEVSERFKALEDDRDRAESEKRRAESSLSNLEIARDEVARLKAKLNQVNLVVLEKARIRLKALLDERGLTGKEFKRLNSLSDKISLLQKEINENLQPERKGITEEITKLETLYAAAERSHRSTVPDDYINTNVSSRRRRGSSGGYSSWSSRPQVINNYYRDDGDGLLTYMLYDSLFHHFDEPVRESSHSHDSSRRSNVNHVDEDRYGRVS